MRKLVLMLILSLFTGCAWLTNGPYTKVNISAANGDNIIATIDGKKHTLPANVEVKPGDLIYIYNKDNPRYHDSTINLGQVEGAATLKTRPTTFLNILGVLAGVFPGLTSIMVDMSTKSQWYYANPKLVIPVYLIHEKDKK